MHRVVKEEMGEKWKMGLCESKTGVSRKCPHRGTVASSGFVSSSCQKQSTSRFNSRFSNEYIQGGMKPQQHSYEMNTCLK